MCTRYSDFLQMLILAVCGQRCVMQMYVFVCMYLYRCMYMYLGLSLFMRVRESNSGDESHDA